MKNELFRIGPFVGYSYGLMIAIGVIAAFLVGEHRAKKKGLDADLIFPLAIWCLIGGILGAKILYYITIFPEIIANPAVLLDVINGFVVYGGIIFGILAGFLYTKKRKVNFWKYFDLVMPSIALAQGFGRVGCLMAGCCYGAETDSWFHIVFHDSSYGPNGVPLIPTQAISSVLNFLHFFFLKRTSGWASGRALPGLLQHRTLYSGILPRRFRTWKRRYLLYIAIYFPVFGSGRSRNLFCCAKDERSVWRIWRNSRRKSREHAGRGLI